MQPECLTAINDARHADIVRRTKLAIANLQTTGKRISFYSVADKAQVSRSTLYRCRDLRELVEQARSGVLPSLQDQPDSLASRMAELEAELARVRQERDTLRQLACSTTSVYYGFTRLPEAA